MENPSLNMTFRITCLDAHGKLGEETISASSADEAWEKARLCWGAANVHRVTQL